MNERSHVIDMSQHPDAHTPHDVEPLDFGRGLPTRIAVSRHQALVSAERLWGRFRRLYIVRESISPPELGGGNHG